MRIFGDDGGTAWTAWEARPGQIVIGAAERRAARARRDAPVPEGWDRPSDAELAALCGRAPDVLSRDDRGRVTEPG